MAEPGASRPQPWRRRTRAKVRQGPSHSSGSDGSGPEDAPWTAIDQTSSSPDRPKGAIGPAPSGHDLKRAAAGQRHQEDRRDRDRERHRAEADETRAAPALVLFVES